MKILSRRLIYSLAVVGALSGCSDDDNGGAPPAPAKQHAAPIVSNGPKAVESEEAAAAQEAATVAEIESKLPPISALDTFGGQLLAGYLQGTIPGEEVIAQTFDDDDYVMSNLAEMSMAIGQLKEEGNYSAANKDKVVVLEGAMTQFLNDRIRDHKNLENVIEYGTAIGLGVIGGVYSNEIINGLKALGKTAAFQTPKNAVRSVFEGAKGQSEKVAAWLSEKGAKAGQSDTVTRTVEKSHSLYNRAAAHIATRGGRVEGKELVLRNIVRIYGSPDLAKGVKVVDVPADDIASVSHMVFHKTGIPGLRLHQVKGDSQLVVKQIKKGGDYEYFYVQGVGIKTLTKNGEEMIVPPSAMASLTAARLRGYGDRSVQFVTDTGRKIKTGYTNSRAYQYASTNPQFRRAVEGTAVGATIGGLTLLALRPIDTRYITLEDYVRDLEAEGVRIEDFLDSKRQQVQTKAGVTQL